MMRLFRSGSAWTRESKTSSASATQRNLFIANSCDWKDSLLFPAPLSGSSVCITKVGAERLHRPRPRKCRRGPRRARPGKWFQATVSAEDVTAGKPDPQVFLIAASRLGAEPHSCVVVEDASRHRSRAPGRNERHRRRQEFLGPGCEPEG